MKMRSGWHTLGIALCMALWYLLPDPHLLSVRPWAEPGLMVLALLGVGAAVWPHALDIWQRRLMVLLWLIVIGLTVLSATAISRQRVAVLQAYADDPTPMILRR